ncbi:MAG: RNA methyltransferase [Proteobacteria bacterium]|nr:RNA methyltransferase [Pseudomonadota bacterium]
MKPRSSQRKNRAGSKGVKGPFYESRCENNSYGKRSDKNDKKVGGLKERQPREAAFGRGLVMKAFCVRSCEDRTSRDTVSFSIHSMNDLREYILSPYGHVSHILVSQKYFGQLKDLLKESRDQQTSSPPVVDVLSGEDFVSAVRWLHDGEDYVMSSQQSVDRGEGWIPFKGCFGRVVVKVCSELTDTVEHPLKTSSNNDVVLALDHLQDPRNLGAIIRSAAFFGICKIILPKDRQVFVSPAVVRSSRCGLGYVQLVEVVNLARCLRALKKEGYWVLGGDMAGEDCVEVCGQYEKTVLVLGSEGNGISSAVEKVCDRMVQVPGKYNRTSSLNVAVAAGILMHSLVGR